MFKFDFLKICITAISLLATTTTGNAFSNTIDTFDGPNPFGLSGCDTFGFIDASEESAFMELRTGPFTVQNAGTHNWFGGVAVPHNMPVTAAGIAQCLGTDVGNITNLQQNGADGTYATDDYIGFKFDLGVAAGGLAQGTHEYKIGTGIIPPDTTAPLLAEVTPVPTPTNDTTPDYIFNSGEAGTVSYGGSCSSATDAATVGNNTVTFTTLAEGTYSDCTITVTDAANNASLPLDVTAFTIDTIVPTVAIVDLPASFSGVTPFEVTIEFSEPVSGLLVDEIVATNAVVSNLSPATGPASVYTVTITPTGAGDITIDVAAGVATDEAGNGNTAAVQAIVGSTTVADTQKVIASYMLNRANHILGNQPDLISLLNGNNGGGGPLGNLSLNANEESMALAFSTSLSKIDQAESKAINDRVALAFAKKEDEEGEDGTQVVEALNTYDTPARGYDVWMEIYGAQGTSGSSDSSLWVGYLGAHYFVTPDLIVGALAQVDWADESDVAAGTSADGTGWMIGPYMAGRIAGTSVAYEARASWGRSDNNVSPLGTYVDSFETERWLASGKISGSFNVEDVTVTPSLEVSYFHETQEAYVDSLTNVIPEQSISLGELRFGPEFSRNITLDNGNTIKPSLGIAGVWNFGVTGDADPSGFALGNSDLRARIDGGITTTNTMGWRFTASAYYDGLGIDDYEALGGKVRLTIPLN